MTESVKNNGRTLYLISKQLLQELQNQNSKTKLFESPELSQSMHLEGELKKILTNRNLSPGERLDAYNQLLTTLRTLKSKMPELKHSSAASSQLPPAHQMPPEAEDDAPFFDAPEPDQQAPQQPGPPPVLIQPDAVAPMVVAPVGAAAAPHPAPIVNDIEADGGLTPDLILKTFQAPSRQQKVSDILDAMRPGKLGYDRRSGEMIIGDVPQPGTNIMHILDVSS